MKRTTVFADEDVLLELKQLARQQGRPVSDLMREALEQYVGSRRGDRPRLPFKAIGSSGLGDLASRADEYIAQGMTRSEGWTNDDRR